MGESSHGAGHERSVRYEIRVEGRLDPRWSSRFDGMSIEWREDGVTVLRGDVPDQAALHGLLARVRDLGLTIVAVKRIEAKGD